MRNDYEGNIDRSLNEEIKIPESILMKKQEAFEIIKREKKNKRKKKIMAACAALSVILLGSVNYADDASAYIKEMFFRDNIGAQTAIDNGYIENMNDLIMEDKGVKIKVDKFSIDDSRAMVSLKINFEDQNIKDIITGLGMRHCIYSNGKEISVSSSSEFTIDEYTKEITYNTVIGLEEKVEADELRLSIDNLELFTDLNSDIEWYGDIIEEHKKSMSEANLKLFDEIEGNWTINIKIDEKFKNPKIISYKQSEENNEIEIISANASPTGMDIKFAYKNQIQEINMPSYIRESLYDMRVTNEEGKEFKCDERLTSNFEENNKSTYEKLFYITSFDCEDTYTFEVTDLNGNIQKIKLEKQS